MDTLVWFKTIHPREFYILAKYLILVHEPLQNFRLFSTAAQVKLKSFFGLDQSQADYFILLPSACHTPSYLKASDDALRRDSTSRRASLSGWYLNASINPSSSSSIVRACPELRDSLLTREICKTNISALNVLQLVVDGLLVVWWTWAIWSER